MLVASLPRGRGIHCSAQTTGHRILVEHPRNNISLWKSRVSDTNVQQRGRQGHCGKKNWASTSAVKETLALGCKHRSSSRGNTCRILGNKNWIEMIRLFFSCRFVTFVLLNTCKICCSIRRFNHHMGIENTARWIFCSKIITLKSCFIFWLGSLHCGFKFWVFVDFVWFLRFSLVFVVVALWFLGFSGLWFLCFHCFWFLCCVFFVCVYSFCIWFVYCPGMPKITCHHNK